MSECRNKTVEEKRLNLVLRIQCNHYNPRMHLFPDGSSVFQNENAPLHQP